LEEFLSALVVFGFSTVKFLSGVAASLGFQQGLLPSYISTVGGGIIGVFAFAFFGEIIGKLFTKIYPNRTIRVFTSWNRFIVKIRRNFGLPGIAMLTPILSIPLGMILAMSLTKNKWRIAFFMLTSFLIWATVIFVPYYLFDLNISETIASWF
jgi:hypothetical protein